MELIKINMNAPQRAIMVLHPVDVIIDGEELLISLSSKECYNINSGEKLLFKRYVYREDNTMFQLTALSNVLFEDSSHIIHASIPNWDEYSVINYEKKEDSYIITTNGHNIFAQDINENSELYLCDVNDNVLLTLSYSDFFIPNKYSLTQITKEDCIISETITDTCGFIPSCEKIITYQYSFLPNKASTTKLVIKLGDKEDVIKNTAYIRTKFNPFYYYYTDSEKIIHCVFYSDPWWDEFKNSETICRKYVNSGDTKSVLGLNDAYWKTGIGLSMESDYDSLGSEDTFNTSFVKDVEDSIIPEIIDVEKIKYSPISHGSNSPLIITSITLDFHFRKRSENDGYNTEQTKDNYYADGWYINSESSSTIWWNGYPSNDTSTTIDSGKMEKFIENSGKTSDLLGYLNFTDSDVYYSKKKVSKTFVRFSYYSKNDENEDIGPLNERLLFYSTVFLDGGKLYGKYVKQLLEIQKTDLDDIYVIPKEYVKEGVTNVVFCKLNNSRVDSEIIITNEYDRTSSSEGFNIYLFKDDAPYLDEEHPEMLTKTIYMKIEFNHAGNGKTIPMILDGMWPRDEKGNYTSLKIDNFLKSLYIPLELKYINGKYYYTVQNAIDENDGNIRLILLEPKLDVKDGDS